MKEFEKISDVDIIDRTCDKEIRALMEEFHATEEDVNVAVAIVGEKRAKVEDFLRTKKERVHGGMW